MPTFISWTFLISYFSVSVLVFLNKVREVGKTKASMRKNNYIKLLSQILKIKNITI